MFGMKDNVHADCNGVHTVSNMKDILIFTPVLRLEPETIQAIFALTWDGAISYLFQRDNPIPEQRDRLKRSVMNHLHQFQRGREVFLKGRYDAMLIVESDIIPPPDALQRLWDLQCDIAYGSYVFRHSKMGDEPIVNIFERYKPWPELPRNEGESLTVRRKWKAALAQGVVECSGAGFGCTLIRRHVMEAIPFRVEWPQNGGHCDTYWTRDAYRKGYKMLADTSVICGHKREDGVILWPTT